MTTKPKPAEPGGMVSQADMDQAPPNQERKNINPNQPNVSDAPLSKDEEAAGRQLLRDAGLEQGQSKGKPQRQAQE